MERKNNRNSCKNAGEGITLSEGNNFVAMNDPSMWGALTVNSDIESVFCSITSRVQACDSSLLAK